MESHLFIISLRFTPLGSVNIFCFNSLHKLTTSLTSLEYNTASNVALFLYVLPLAALTLGAVIGQWYAQEMGAVLFSVCAFVVSLVIIHYTQKRQHDNCLPIISKKILKIRPSPQTKTTPPIAYSI